MAKQAEITYLWNSGFVVKLDDCALVFDYYRDPAQSLPAVLSGCKKIYFFVSHSHADHFSPAISAFAGQADRYFLSADVRGSEGSDGIPADKAVYLDTYDAYEDETVKVKTYSSTDEGTSFLVEAAEWRIFHAGDFNWWHWKGDTPLNIAFAKNGFMKQMKHLDGLRADVAFFPVDRRLEEFCSLGAKEFCRRTRVDYLIAMHNAGNEPWNGEKEFFAPGREIPIWGPKLPGETKIIEKQESIQ